MDEKEFQIRKVFYAETIHMMSDYCIEGLRMLFWASIGAAAALLIFMSKLDTLGQPSQAFRFFIPLAMFFLSALLASGTLCLSYLSQMFYTSRAFLPGVSMSGVLFQVLAIFCTLFAYAACLYGAWRAGLIFMGA
jgi:hypothetical protein